MAEGSVVSQTTYPIRLINGFGNNHVRGFVAVYEKPDGTVGSISVWYDNDPDFYTLRLVRFVDGPSQITWTKTETPDPVWFDKNRIKKTDKVTLIEINRNFQSSVAPKVE